jgi:hypothetical protein
VATAVVAHRIAEVRIDPDDTRAVARHGETLARLAASLPRPVVRRFLHPRTAGLRPRPLTDAMTETVSWLRDIDQI